MWTQAPGVASEQLPENTPEQKRVTTSEESSKRTLEDKADNAAELIKPANLEQIAKVAETEKVKLYHINYIINYVTLFKVILYIVSTYLQF